MAHTIQDARLAFVVDYQDPQAGIVRQYQLLYFLTDKTLEMFDLKNRRIFLKRCSYPSVSHTELHIGATVNIYSRQLTVTDYGDEYTRQVFSKRSESTLGIIGPDGYERMGEIFECIAREGLKVRNIHMVQMAPEEAAQLFGESQQNPEYREVIDHMTAYPVVGIHLSGEDCVNRWKALANDLRSKYSTSAVCNVVHASADQRRARLELQFFFGPDSSVKTRNNAALSNCTLGIVKPHAVQAGLGGTIIQTIFDEGFEISAIGLVHLNDEDAEDFLEVYKGVVPEYQGMLRELTVGPCWVMEIRAEDAVNAFRGLCGPHDPEIARVLRPDSLRAKLGTDKLKNALHCTDLPDDGVSEVEFFFRIMGPRMVETRL